MEIFQPKKKVFTDSFLVDFKTSNPQDTIIDGYEEQLHELFLIRNPEFRFVSDYKSQLTEFIKNETGGKSLVECGNWFYFQWTRTLIHYLPEEEYLELRTARNKNLITSEEQGKFYNQCIGFAGLSVGSHAALTTAIMGGAKRIKLADPDEISITNLNRLRYGASVVGTNKALVAARLISEINPYAEIYLYQEGVNQNNLSDFVAGEGGTPKVDVLVEGVDNLPIKIILREFCKNYKIPVIMATDNGDGVIVDIERFDTEESVEIFNGALGDFNMDDFKNFSPADLPRLATKVAGPEYVVPRMLSSLLEVGKTLYSWPQLGSAATFSGVVTAYLLRAMAEGRNIKSGKYNMSLESVFEPDSLKDIEAERKQYLSKMNL